MITMLLFSVTAALLVLLAGLGDKARDPRLSGLALALLAVFPVLLMIAPEWGILPTRQGSDGGFPWGKIVAGMWTVGCLFGSVRLLLAALTIMKWRKGSTLIRLVGRVEIRCLVGLTGPVAAGVMRALIFVPAEWSRWPAATRRVVLKHELAHHRRRDPLWRWMAEIACVIHGLNPLVVWISRRLVLQCECACDAQVIEKGVKPTEYARLLCDLAADRPLRGPVLAMATRSTLESRVTRMVRPRPRGSAILLGLLLAAMTAMAGIFAALRPAAAVPQSEIDLRWSANPFPGE